MEIITVKLKFARLPFLRKTDVISHNAAKIILCAEDLKNIKEGINQIEYIHPQNIKDGYEGFRWHYVIKNAGQHDGLIYYCRPKIYQNEVVKNNSEKTNKINNYISILVADKYNSNLTTLQRESLIKLLVFLCEQEKMKPAQISLLSELTGSANKEFNDWQSIRQEVIDKVTEINKFKTILENYPIDGVTPNVPYESMVTRESISFVNLSLSIKVGSFTLQEMNPHITSDPIPPNTVVFIPKSEATMKAIAAQQESKTESAIGYMREIVDRKIIEKKEYIAWKEEVKDDHFLKKGFPGIPDDVYDPVIASTMRGGKRKPNWLQKPHEFPGYHNAFLEIRGKDNNLIQRLRFLVSPSSFTDSRSNLKQMSKTNAGWFVMRTGRNIGTLSMSGYMLDTYEVGERHNFFEQYKKYVEDHKNDQWEYYNNYKTKIVIEGRDYYGYIQDINFSKSAMQPFLYQYNLTFMCLGDKEVYNKAYAVRDYRTLGIMDAQNTQTFQQAVAPYADLPTTTTLGDIVANKIKEYGGRGDIDAKEISNLLEFIELTQQGIYDPGLAVSEVENSLASGG